jgi:imidazolonepropionase-like amidohydrolase
MDGTPIENGAVLVAGNKINDVGPWESLGSNGGGEVIDLGEQVLLPGLINAHCHLETPRSEEDLAPEELHRMDQGDQRAEG